MSRRAWRNLGALSGVAFGVFEVVGFSLGAAGAPRLSKEQIASAYLNGTPTLAWLGQYLVILSALFLVIFAARVRGALRNDQDGLDWISTAALGGALVFAVCELAGVSAYGAIRLRSDHSLDVEEAVALADLGQALVVVGVAGLGLFLSATAARILQTRALPVWLGWSGALLAIAVLAVVGLPFLPFGMTVEPLVLLWILAVAIMLIRGDKGRDSRYA
jgi:hypothetical protein